MWACNCDTKQPHDLKQNAHTCHTLPTLWPRDRRALSLEFWSNSAFWGCRAVAQRAVRCPSEDAQGNNPIWLRATPKSCLDTYNVEKNLIRLFGSPPARSVFSLPSCGEMDHAHQTTGKFRLAACENWDSMSRLVPVSVSLTRGWIHPEFGPNRKNHTFLPSAFKTLGVVGVQL